MKSTILLFSILLATLLAKAQGSSFQSLQDQVSRKNPLFLNETIAGSPYFSEEKTMGSFYKKNNEVIETPTMLNLFKNNFEFESNGATLVLDIQALDSIRYMNGTYVFKEIDVNNSNKTKVVKVVYRNHNIALYYLNEIELVPQVKAGPYVEAKPPTYKPYEPIYIIEVDNKLTTLKSYNKLYTLFPEKKEQIKGFIKKNKIKKDNQTDLISLVQFIQTLG